MTSIEPPPPLLPHPRLVQQSKPVDGRGREEAEANVDGMSANGTAGIANEGFHFTGEEEKKEAVEEEEEDEDEKKDKKKKKEKEKDEPTLPPVGMLKVVSEGYKSVGERSLYFDFFLVFLDS